jgi:hypothetical protein
VRRPKKNARGKSRATRSTVDGDAGRNSESQKARVGVSPSRARIRGEERLGKRAGLKSRESNPREKITRISPPRALQCRRDQSWMREKYTSRAINRMVVQQAAKAWEKFKEAVL